MKDYYYILGIKKTASAEEIKQAYRKLSTKFHPDKNDGDEFFTERFKEIQEAYEVLADSQKKSEYDSNGINFAKSQNDNHHFKPIISSFSADKNYIEYDSDITFSWKTTNANNVSILPFGKVNPIGSKTYKIRNLKKESLTFKLVAENSNINQSTSSTITLINKTYQELELEIRNKLEKEKKSIEDHRKLNKNSNRPPYNSIGPEREIGTTDKILGISVFIIILALVIFVVYLSNKS